MAGDRTRIDCLEGNHANLYTTDARCDSENCVAMGDYNIYISCIQLLDVNALRT